MSESETPPQLDNWTLLACWSLQADRSRMAHFRISSTRFKWNGVLSFLVVLGSAAVGSTLFVSLNSSTKSGWQHWVLASVSSAVAVLAGVQKGSRLEQSAEEHRQAGARWNVILIKISALRARHPEHDLPSDAVDEIATDMERLIQSSPSVSEAQFRHFQIDEAYKCLGVEPPKRRGAVPRVLDRVTALFKRS